MGTMKPKPESKPTRSEIESLALEAEAGYDLEHARRRRGRPSLGEEGSSERLQVRIDPKLAAALRKFANSKNSTVSEVARTALRAYVERQ